MSDFVFPMILSIAANFMLVKFYASKNECKCTNKILYNTGLSVRFVIFATNAVVIHAIVMGVLYPININCCYSTNL